MANVTEGLQVGGDQGLDPNDPRDFELILEGKGVPKEEGEGQTPSTDVRSGLTTHEPGQAREPETGRFVAKETPAPVEDTSRTAPDTSAVTVAADDPEVAAFLAKYNNDPEAALKAAVNAQSLLGRQGEELGKTREELAELRGLVEGLKQTAAAPSPAPVLTADQVEEQAQALLDSNGSYFDAATAAANQAHTTGDERVYRSIMEQWNLESPMEALDFNTDFRIWQREQRTAAERQPQQTPEWVTQAAEQHKINGIEVALRSIAGEYEPETWQAVSSQFDAAFDSMPKNVLAMIDSTDPEAREAGVRLVIDRAELLASKAGAAAPAAPQEQQVPASVVRKLAGSAVASSALKAPPKRNDAPETREQAIAEFKRQIVEAPTTNVASGLTYGPQP